MRKYYRSDGYDRAFVEENMMGPCSMKLLEQLVDRLDLKPGMRVLDLGCGKGLTSIFLAKEMGVTVFAADLWISATENLLRFRSLGLEERIIPIHAEAHELPFADGYFDAAVSIDSYHYFGANDSYLSQHFARLVRSGGRLAMAAPGLTREPPDAVPESLSGIIKDEEAAFATFKTAGWWRDNWEKSGLVDISGSGELEDSKPLWMDWAKIARERLGFNDDELLAADTEDWLTLVYIIAEIK